MCHRQLRFVASDKCGHLTFTGESSIDCNEQICLLSSAHPSNCVAPACRCRRYWTQPERVVTDHTADPCPVCKQQHSR